MKTSEKLYLAAGIAFARGMNDYIRYCHKGTVCALGALDQVNKMQGLSEHDDTLYDDASTALFERLVIMDVPETWHNYGTRNSANDTYGKRSAIAQWSNRMVADGKDKEVIALFRAVAADLAKVGQ